MSKASPALQQYFDIKEQYHNYLLFFQMGDFYELFFEDAVRASQALDITLTKRGSYNGEGVPMCGVPLHASQNYVQRLIRQGFSIALCEQTETPETKEGKGPLKREVTRVITPGTLTEDALLDSKSHHFIGCVFRESHTEKWACALIDLSTGDFFTEVFEHISHSVLLNWKPKEILIPDFLVDTLWLSELRLQSDAVMTPLSTSRFHHENGVSHLKAFFHVQTLQAFGEFHALEHRVAGTLLDYICITQKKKEGFLSPPRQISTDRFLKIDPFTRKNLELTRTLEGEKKGSLLHLIDRTVTAAGGRFLESALQAPLSNVDDIQKRLNAVDFFYTHIHMAHNVRTALKKCTDIERALARLFLGRGGPRDLAALRDTFELIPYLKEVFENQALETSILTAERQGIFLNFSECDFLVTGLKEDASFALPVTFKEGGFVREGYSEELEEWRNLSTEAGSILRELEERYKRETHISTLKIKENNLMGLFIEVSQGQVSKVPVSFMMKQKTIQGQRYVTQELLALQSKRQEAHTRVVELELSVFQEWVKKLEEMQTPLRRLAKALTSLDVYTSLAVLAQEGNYVKPSIDSSRAFSIHQGFHPVVKTRLRENAQEFVANDCILENHEHAWLLTGPNMAGKSTFLRQNALIVVMSHLGSFVPAQSAHIGVCDRIFSRVGASDNLARGESTFMVEMVETARILHQATPKSFVILDEIGRGTATYDGLALAWACFEFLVKKHQCRSLFATHYHELTALEGQVEGVACYTPRITEWKNDIIFSHEIIRGKAQGSYGIHVARLAGVPEMVLRKAEEIQTKFSDVKPLSSLEKELECLDLSHVSAQEAQKILTSFQHRLRVQVAEDKREVA